MRIASNGHLPGLHLLMLMAAAATPTIMAFSRHQQQQLLTDRFQGQMVLAPLTRGGNYPFRRLCQDFGMKISMGEMVFARNLLRGDPVERARLRRPPPNQQQRHQDALFGVQIATNNAREGAAAMRLAQEAGADFVDLNTGCPLYEATRRGLGSALLRNPAKLGSLVQGMIQEAAASHCDIPLTVKIRLGCEADTLNVLQVAQKVRNAGVAALTVHGRTAMQGYSKSADWNWIQKVVEDNTNAESDMPIIGNGDILTYYEARRRMETSGVDAVMVGRGALIKPWIFQEFVESQEWHLSLSDRIAVYRRLACYMKDYFGDDATGRSRSWAFLPWHLDFFARYLPLPEDKFGELSTRHPLIQSRLVSSNDMLPLEALLCNRNPEAHDIIAGVLWESQSDVEAVSKLEAFAESHEFAEIQRYEDFPTETAELSNVPSTEGLGSTRKKRKERTPKPKRTPEEIAIIRAERAAKRAATGSTYVHVEGARRASHSFFPRNILVLYFMMSKRQGRGNLFHLFALGTLLVTTRCPSTRAFLTKNLGIQYYPKHANVPRVTYYSPTHRRKRTVFSFFGDKDDDDEDEDCSIFNLDACNDDELERVRRMTSTGGRNDRSLDRSLKQLLSAPMLEVVLAVLVLLSSFLVGVGTLQSIPSNLMSVIQASELVVSVVFTVEYAIRWKLSGFSPKYVVQPLAIIDLIAILPGVIKMFAMLGIAMPQSLSGGALINLRLLRILRLQRVLTDYETFSKFEQALGLDPSDIRPYQLQLARVVISIFTLLSVTAGLIYSAEYGVNPDIPDYFTALYFALTTISTVGFGDISPVTTSGRFVVSGSILIGVAVLPAQAAALVEALRDPSSKDDFRQDTNDPDDIHTSLRSVDSRIKRLEEKLDEANERMDRILKKIETKL